MVTSPYEWKFLELDEKPKTNKQTNNQTNDSELFEFSSKGETYIHVYTKYFIFHFSICQIALLNFIMNTISDDEFM